MNYRHELKHEINIMDMFSLRQRLRAVCRVDEHSIDGKYKIRSLYFDNLYDKALREKIDGVNRRQKFRIRYYNDSLSQINLEKKSKINGLCCKQSASLTFEAADKLVRGDYSWMMESENQLIKEFYSKLNSEGLRPKTIVDYTREAFVYTVGNVRITLDYNIKTGVDGTSFLSSDCVMIPADNGTIILEVKWDNVLPEIIRDIVQLSGRRATAFSKYAACRIYG